MIGNSGPLSTLAVFVIVLTTLFLLLNQNWRWSITALVIQYLAVFVLTAQVWPFGLAAAKLVAGWMAGAVLSASQPPAQPAVEDQGWGATFVFRLLAAALVWILAFTLSPMVVSIIPLSPSLVTGTVLLIGMGLLHLGMTTRPMRVLAGLLTTLSGFELIYAAVESSVLVAGLQAVVTLGLSLVGAYLLETSADKEGAA
ncbi:MAG: hypothetical protein GX491_12165 [Chloroflexi bacterium]|nr:hypothetical protein [Chloroflexota bacterium]